MQEPYSCPRCKKSVFVLYQTKLSEGEEICYNCIDEMIGAMSKKKSHPQREVGISTTINLNQFSRSKL